MLCLPHEVNEHIAGFNSCPDLDAVRDKFHTAFEAFGFSNSTYVRFHLSEYDRLSSQIFSQQMVFSTTCPDDWRSRYREQNYHQIDPIFRRCRQSVVPQVWPDAARDHELNRMQRLFFGEATECGLPCGLAVPVHGPGGEFAVVSLITDEPTREFVHRMATYKHTFHILSFHLHVAIHELLHEVAEEPFIRLTPRERECLKWTARGKSSWAISEILALSERTVNFHIANAMNKLNVTSRTHAVAKSLYHGLIEL